MSDSTQPLEPSATSAKSEEVSEETLVRRAKRGDLRAGKVRQLGRAEPRDLVACKHADMGGRQAGDLGGSQLAKFGGCQGLDL